MNESPAGPPASPELPRGLAALTELAMDLRWSWHHGTDALWSRLDPELWERTRHPNDVLQAVSHDRLTAALADPAFNRELDRLVLANREAESAPAWFQHAHSQSPLTCVAYFCMEFMLSEALPIYSGGLGNVAGDQLKAASDLGVPVVGIGLLYQHGYFRQVIDHDGAQQAIYPYNDPAQMPITAVRTPNGDWLRLEIVLPGGSVWLRIWQARVGRITLYLLDTNDTANAPVHRGITSELYGGDTELRLKQEMLLGLGGWRLLTALGLRPEVCHLNEGHAAFAVLERARQFMAENSQPFAVALAATRAGNVFTTHTAVEAGFDRFDPALIERYLGWYARDHLRITVGELLALGRRNPADAGEPFTMAYLALRGCGAVNGVSQLHGRVSRHLFAPLFPGWPEDEVPIGHVTNGVHMPTWDSPAADALWTETCGQDRWRGSAENLGAKLRFVSDESLWALRTTSRAALVTFARDCVGKQMAAAGADAAAIGRTQARLDPAVLTLGFARRFATYKRTNLLLHDPARLLRILQHPTRPAQLILAGKAHPADQAGQALIKAWTAFIRSHDSAPPVIFLADYDMLLAEQLVQGVDVWINTPRRPWEASGTSGMKVLVNGGLNLSELDGWWAEAYRPDAGWALGDGQEHGDDPDWDAAEADALYTRLEAEVIPEFYARDELGLPKAWVARIRESMAHLTPRFSATRTVQEYTEQRYLPAAAAFRLRAADHAREAQAVVNGRKEWDATGASISFDHLAVETSGRGHVIVVDVFLGDIPPVGVRVELYADARTHGGPVHQEMTRIRNDATPSGRHTYCATVPSDRPASDYTARITPHGHGLQVPLESGGIRWQK